MALSYGGPTIISSPFFVEGVLPFLLVFVLVFAVLQKSKIFGDEKKQINALIALVVGLIVISFSYYTNIIVSLIPILAVGLVVILVFLMLWGIVFVNKDEFSVPNWVKYAVGGMAFLAVLISMLIITGAWDYFRTNWGSSQIFSNVVFLVIVGIAIAVIVGFGGGSGGHGKKE